MLGLHNLKVRSFVLDVDDYFQRQASESGSRLSRPSWLGADFSPLDFGKSRGFTNRILKTLSQGDVRNLLLQRESTLGDYWAGLSPVSAETNLAYSQATPRIHIWQQLFLFYGRVSMSRWCSIACTATTDVLSDNLPYLIEQREDTAACINKAAASVGLSNRFDIQRMWIIAV